MGDPTPLRFYGELAPWWPLISPPEDYAEEAAEVSRILASAGTPVREVLELGSGGGHNAFHLKREYSLTLTDLSPAMLDMSRRLNPECEHHQGDMRDLRLGRAFDAVFVHDAVMYMTTEDDLRAAIRTAYVHCRPGGVAVIVPDWITETFTPGTDNGGSDGDDGSGARYLEWMWDPDPNDTEVLSELAFLLRDATGAVRAVHETHRWGLFLRDTWLRLLRDEGFEPTTLTEQTTEDRPARTIFLCRRPTT